MQIIKDRATIDFLTDRWVVSGMYFKEIQFFGVRNFDTIKESVFDDTIGILTEDTIYLMKGTTDPSKTYIKDRPMNPNGTAVMCLGSQQDIWCVGQHPLGKSHYTALVNTGANPNCKQQEVWRLDKDFKFKVDSSNNRIIYKGYFGCNFHRASEFKIEDHIGGWSAGCVVVQDIADFNEVMKLVYNTEMYKKDKACTFSLLMLDKGEVTTELTV